MITAKRAYAMLGNESLWDVAQRCHELLAREEIPHAVIGGVAVCLHGYQRNTVDLDLLVRPEDLIAIRETLEAAGFEWIEKQAEFHAPSGTPVQLLLAGERAGPASEVRFSDPSEKSDVTEREGLPVVTLARLIEFKLACGLASLRRTHKDFADVVELIAAHKLSRSFARFLHKSVRDTFRKLVGHARDSK